MTDYISREALLDRVYALRDKLQLDLNNPFEDGVRIGFENVEIEIENYPAADVRPVARGKWETVMLDHERMGCRPTAHYCSECHQITWFRTFYCPNCGADMRESKQESKQVGILEEES